ncbi:putative Ig domain-containing protein [Usitatibacter palustris]|uniref:Fibronectin type-III domain-containing protein n=1 Tax=Usitatibacter palustris TaxID=2732487 RepID=A0A6M4HBG0_9PROT|nr:putative Ig domain-containing protein [Usitatibacter palustris]QJR16572.1 hypothetical protein DSM104440_03407 [Usitatibacter palustris]
MRTSNLFRTLASVLLVVALPAAAQRITTYAGGGVGEQSPALNALLIGPSHLAVDRFDNLHVTDREGNRVLKITPSGVISTVMGTGFPGRLVSYNAATQKVSSPSGIVFRPTPFNFDPAVDELVFADTGNHWIVAIDTVTATETVPYTEMGTSFQGYCCDNFNVFADFDTPQGLAVDAVGNVYIADTNNHIVRRSNWHNYMTPPTIDRIAGLPQQAGSTGDGAAALDAKLQHPLAVAIDAAGDLYIAESHRIRKVNMATGIITTLVGTTVAGFTADGVISGSFQISAPTDLKFGPDGNLYFVDSGNYRVRRIVGGNVQTVAGTGATSDSGDGFAATGAGLAGPRGIVFNAAGDLFVTMHDSGKIRRIAAGTGIITTYAGGAVLQPNGGSFAGEGGRPSGIALNSPAGATPMTDGSVYLADSSNHRVRLATADNGVTTTIAGNGTPGSTGDGGLATAATLNTPVSVAVDAAGNRYIADANNARVRKIDTSGIITNFAGGGASFPGNGGPATSAQLTGPSWVVVHGSDVFIADGPGNRIVQVTAGVLTTVAGTGTPGSTGDGGPASAATLDFPASFVFDASDNMFIVEALGNRVRRVTPGGTISTVAGIGSAGFSGDGGPATSAELDLPMGIAVDTVGALYISDGNNHRIRKVLPNGTIKTMAGNGNPGFAGDGGDSPGAQLNQPSFITRDANGRLYVADTDNHRVRRIAPRVPFAPTIGTVTPASGSISVAFTPPADDGNAPVLEYGAECNGPVNGGNAGSASPIVVSGLTNGASYTCFVYARNSVDWGESSATSAAVTVGVAPAITSSAPPATAPPNVAYSHTYTATGAPAPTFSVTAGALPTGLNLSAAGVISGTPTVGGTFTGTVTATNGLPPDATQNFSIQVTDTTPPDTTITLAPSAFSNTAAPSFTFTGTDPESGVASFQCKLDAGAFAACTSPQAYSGLAAGSHTFQVRAIDNATNADASPASHTWTIDLTAPETTITATPPTLTNGTGASFTFSGTDAGSGVASFECNLDADPFAACTSPKTYVGLAAGSRTFRVRAIDAAGNTDATPATFTWTIDVLEPTLAITSKPPISIANQGEYIVGGTCSEAGRTVNVQIGSVAASGICTGSAFTTTGVDVSPLPQGAVSLTATLTDAAGNTKSVTDGTTKDTVSAALTIGVLDAINNANKAAYAFAGTCETGGGPVSFSFTATAVVSGTAPCVTAGYSKTSLNLASLAEGNVQVSVSQTDSNGNPGTTQGSTLKDTVNPQVTIDTFGAIVGPTFTGLFVRGTCSENGRNVAVAVGSILASAPCGTPAPGLFHTAAMDVTPVPDGPVSVSATHLDAAGNTAIALFATSKNSSPAAIPRMANISTRGQVLTGADVMIAGFIIGGTTPKTVIVTVAGPSLVNAGITNALANPTLTLVRSSDGAVIGNNDNWQDAANAAAIQAAGFAPAHPNEPAVMMTLAPGAYTAIVQGAGGRTGVGLVGVYEVDHPEVPLINISTRGQVLTGNDVMIAGFIIQGTNTQPLVVTVAGPSLVNAGIANPLMNPTLIIVRASDGAVIATNDDWQTQTNPLDVGFIQSAGFAPAHPQEPAVFLNLPPGAYTAIVVGAGGGTGVGLVGVYKAF